MSTGAISLFDKVLMFRKNGRCMVLHSTRIKTMDNDTVKGTRNRKREKKSVHTVGFEPMTLK